MLFIGFVFLQQLFLRIVGSSKKKASPANLKLTEDTVEKICFFCKDYKDENTKHCDVCKSCVPNFDHHCYYISNCVGEGNHYMFLSFLVNLIVLLTIEFLVSLFILINFYFQYQEKFDFLLQLGYGGVAGGLLVDGVRVFFSFQLLFFTFCLFYLFYCSLGKWKQYYVPDANKKTFTQAAKFLKKIEERDSWICINRSS